MSIKNGFHYDDYNRRYYRNEQGKKIKESICICSAKESYDCVCDCTNWGCKPCSDYIKQLDWQEHQEDTRYE